MSKQFDITISHATLLVIAGAVVAVVLTLHPPAWLTITLFHWLFWSVIALLYMAEKPRRDFVEGTLRHPRFTQIYAVPTRWAVDWFWGRYCDENYEGSAFFKTFHHALTWKLYDKALLIAAAYPVLLLTVFWIATGRDGKLGNINVLPAADLWPEQVATFGVIAIFVLGMIAKNLAAVSQYNVIRKAAIPLLILTVVGSVAVGHASSVGKAYTYAFTLAACITVALAFAKTPAGAFSIAFVFAIEILDKKNKPQLTRWLVTLMLPLGWIILLVILSWTEVNEQSRAIFLFLGVFPLINALFDVVSYAVTLTLLRLGLRMNHPIMNGLADLATAMILFLALGACLTALITAMNALAGTPLFDLGALFDGIRAAPSDYYWLYLMMFSTLLPTAMHGALTVLGVQSITPRFLRRPVAYLVKASPNRTLEATLAPFAVGAVWSVPFLAIGAISYWGWPHAGWIFTSIGWFYLDTLSAQAQILALLYFAYPLLLEAIAGGNRLQRFSLFQASLLYPRQVYALGPVFPCHYQGHRRTCLRQPLLRPL